MVAVCPGEVYGRLQRFSEAERWHRLALRASPAHLPARLTYARLLAQWDRPDEAEREFWTARTLAPNDSSVHHHYVKLTSVAKATIYKYHLGLELGNASQHIDLPTLWERTLAVHRWRSLSRGHFLREQRRVSEAADSFIQAALLSPDHYDTILTAANTLRYDGIPIQLLNISSGYCIQVICILLMISGIEPNPGPKKQTTLFTEPTPTVKESPDTELKTMIVQMPSEIRNLGERLDTRLSNIEKRIIEWDQRLLGVEMKLTTCVETMAATNEIVSENVIKLREIEARTDFLEMKLREPNLVFYGVEGEANEAPAESLQKIDKQISNIVSIQPPFDKTLTAKTSKIENSKVTKNLSDRNTTKIRYLHMKNCESAIKDKQLTQAKHIDTKIKILQWNINGFNRITSIFPLVEYLKKYELFALNETWITGVIELLTDEYYIIQSPALKTELKGRGSGGILIGIKKNFQHTVRKIETNPYWISVLTHKFLDKTTESICLLFAYLPPNALQEQNLTNLLRHIDYHMSEGNEVLIAGDINIRIGNAGGFHNPLKLNSPLNKYRNSKDLISSKLSEKLISFTDSNSITIANGRTRGDTHGSFTFISERGSSVLDYFMYSHGLTQIISDMWIEELSYSDHLPIVLQINTGYEAIKSSYKNEILTRKFIWTKENVERLKHNLSDIEVGNETDINMETVNFTKQIYTAMESANIIKFAKRRHQLSKPWNSNNMHDRQKYIEARREYFKLLQRKRDEFNKDKNEKIKNAKDPKSFWNANASSRKKPIIQGEINIKEWFLFYKNLLNKENKEATFTLNQMIGWKDPDLDAEITLEEIHDVVKKLANGKAVGLDGIPNELLKNLPIPTLTKLKNLFNKIMSTEKYPQLWTNSIVHPIYKSGDKNNPTNYRGIALCSNISKLFTTILRNRLNKWIEKKRDYFRKPSRFPQAGRHVEAERYYRMAVELRPNVQEVSGHLNLGALLHLTGRHSEAEVSYRTALRLRPGDPTALTNLRSLQQRKTS
ncbi:hypothetical protein LAZ67_7002026 [Cordylochernes scorpioides]|uniref:Endonuclease/exonuclease/phosphatase domain-containing protein n=1 Tax=Cordylochernes scorpioides TaxID=51811 RepID=A0ABY6KQM9_9ARAC|nr:hypothetical protein LAZ67_7002026 [Cordylochernes scorpioides]